MTNIWAEKPEPRMDAEPQYYWKDEMNAWLEKVKEHSDYYENLAAEFAELYAGANEKAEKCQYHKEQSSERGKRVSTLQKSRDAFLNSLIQLEDKLEAVNTHMTKWVSGHSDWQMGRMSQWKKELDEILEAEA